MQRGTSNLIIVSNRLPIQLTERAGRISMRVSDGGLVSGLKSYFDSPDQGAHFKRKIWVGAADFPLNRWTRYQSLAEPDPTFFIEPIFVNKKEYHDYYNGFCNATLWPLFHYFPSFVEYTHKTFESYERVNREFCEKVISLAKPGDTIWIHDYQLMLLPEMIRQQRKDVSIGFFLHIPFPSFELFRLLHKTWKEKIIAGLLGSDLIGFHTHGYLHHFLDSAYQVLGVAQQSRIIGWNSRRLKVDAFPLGIDYEKFNIVPDSRTIRKEKEHIKLRLEHSKIIFSVDRLDYTKGITHRLAGLEKFLELFPGWRGKVTFVLVVIPSRQIISRYSERKVMIEELVSRINGKYSTLNWQPILYRYNTLPFAELSALYQTAHIALITPLRDGMNLVAKEYVASRTDKTGVLILSELAGASHEMSEALLVNPTDKREVALAIDRGLNMDLAEQARRITSLQEKLRKNNVSNWVTSFMSQLTGIVSESVARTPKVITDVLTSELKRKIDRARKRLILLDYDGTLVPFQDDPALAVPPQDLVNDLATIASHDENVIAIISGRKLEFLEKWFGELPVHLIGEHGAKLRLVGAPAVTQIPEPAVFSDAIRSTLQMFTFRCKGSQMEEKEFSLAWHYRRMEPEEGLKQSRELIDCLNHLVIGTTLNIIDGNKVVEVRSVLASKGITAERVCNLLSPDMIIALGDDATDEDMFERLSGLASTVKVGNGVTKAHYSLPGQEGVLPFMRNLFLHK